MAKQAKVNLNVVGNESSGGNQGGVAGFFSR
jgi:hypothetical protein